ncbi:unnamed protein product [Knipowitschia caucasica]|uniref:Hexosyltransferase n=1 Tax=Knipowitschia caucasica TaxID=637954 RepID=A0AAV2MLB5_KNICA
MPHVQCRWWNCVLCLCGPCICVLLLFIYVAVMTTVAMNRHIAGQISAGSAFRDVAVPPVIKPRSNPKDRFVAKGAERSKKNGPTPKVFWEKGDNTPLWNQLQKVVDDGLNPILHPGVSEDPGPLGASLLSQSLSELRSETLMEPLRHYVRSMSRRQYPLLMEPRGRCGVGGTQDGGPALLLLAIRSRALSYRSRQAIRESWGQGGWVRTQSGDGMGAYVRRVFLLGTESSGALTHASSELLTLEQQHYGDLLQWELWDSPMNRTLLQLHFWAWVTHNCAHTTFVFEGDDQVFVNTPALVALLQAQLQEPRGPRLQDVMLGKVLSREQPNRSPLSSHFVPESFYKGSYPLLASGTGRVSSALLLRRLLQVSHRVHLFPVEQVYVGMCMIRLNLSPTHHPAFLPSDSDSGWTKEQQEELCAPRRAVVLDAHSHTQVLQLWERANKALCTNTTVAPHTTKGPIVTPGGEQGHVW